MFAPIRPRPIIPSCMRWSSLEERSFEQTQSAGGPGRRRISVFEEIDEPAVAPSNLGNRLLARRLLGPPGDQRIPEIGAADRKAYEAGHRSRDAQPLPDLRVVLATPEDDAADPLAPAGARRRDDRRAVLAS